MERFVEINNFNCVPNSSFPQNEEAHQNQDIPVVFSISVLKQSFWNIYSFCQATASAAHYNQSMLLLSFLYIYLDV